MDYYLISRERLSEVAQNLYDSEEISYSAYMNLEEIIVDRIAPIQWLPIDPANPIPKPTNERQVLQLYKPAFDNEQSLRTSQSPIVSFKSLLYGGLKATRPLHTLFYWDNYDWRSEIAEGKSNEENWLEIGYTQYCIFETPKPTQP